MTNTITDTWSLAERDAWLDWLLLWKGINPNLANDLVLAEPDDPRGIYGDAVALAQEWFQWHREPMEIPR